MYIDQVQSKLRRSYKLNWMQIDMGRMEGGCLLKARQEVKHNFFQLGIRRFRDLAISPRTEKVIY